MLWLISTRLLPFNHQCFHYSLDILHDVRADTVILSLKKQHRSALTWIQYEETMHKRFPLESKLTLKHCFPTADAKHCTLCSTGSFGPWHEVQAISTYFAEVSWVQLLISWRAFVSCSKCEFHETHASFIEIMHFPRANPIKASSCLTGHYLEVMLLLFNGRNLFFGGKK